MKYQVWVIARDRKTLQPVAEALVFEHEDRLHVEGYNEALKPAAIATYLFGVMVTAQNPLYTTETRIPGWGTPAAQYKPGDPDRVGQAVIVGGGGRGQRCCCTPPEPGVSTRCAKCGRSV